MRSLYRRDQLEKKAFFIPTPGQYEQEYLAEKLEKEGRVPYAKQEDFSMKNIFEVEKYKGLSGFQKEVNWQNLFDIFEK